MAIEISALSYLLSSIASTGKIIETAMSLGRAIPAAEAEHLKLTAEQEAEQRFASVSPAVMAMGGRMTDEIVKAIISRMEDSKNLIVKAMSDNTMSNLDREERLKVARHDFCWSMHQLKYHSGGVLPADIQEEWEMNMCDRYDFQL